MKWVKAHKDKLCRGSAGSGLSLETSESTPEVGKNNAWKKAGRRRKKVCVS